MNMQSEQADKKKQDNQNQQTDEIKQDNQNQQTNEIKQNEDCTLECIFQRITYLDERITKLTVFVESLTTSITESLTTSITESLTTSITESLTTSIKNLSNKIDSNAEYYKLLYRKLMIEYENTSRKSNSDYTKLSNLYSTYAKQLIKVDEKIDYLTEALKKQKDENNSSFSALFNMITDNKKRDQSYADHIEQIEKLTVKVHQLEDCRDDHAVKINDLLDKS